jgi:hypothetical protein
MRYLHCGSLVLLCLLALSACASSAAALANSNPRFDGLPAVSRLDGLHGASVLVDEAIDLNTAIDSRHATYQAPEDELLLEAPASEIAYAVFRYTPPAGTTAAILALGDDPLWLLVADFDPAVDHWVCAGQLSGGTRQADLADLGNYTSPGGFIYVAVVCAQGTSGVLSLLAALNDVPDPYNLNVSPRPDAQAILLSWDGGLADSFQIYRSTLNNDPAPYLVDTVADTPAGNIWLEFIPPDAGDGTWTAATSDNATPADTTDDFPFIAPGVTYYYYIVGAGGVCDGVASDTGFALVPWGDRRSTRRELPSSLDRVQVFADQLLPNNMTPAQVQWCAENLCGTQKVFKWQAADFRQYNPDFIVLGYHLGVGAGEIGNVCGGPTPGSGWDDDADWPYVDRHNTWFAILPGSTQPGGRILQQDWNWYLANPSSPWQEYLADNLLQTLGEDHFDGWFIDSCSEPWNTDPNPWWPDGDTMFGWLTPRLDSMLQFVNAAADAHPLQPYIIPNAGAFVTTASDIKYYGSAWSCDGIMVENYGRWAPGDHFTKVDWLLELDRVIDHEQHGLAVIMQAGIDIGNNKDRIFMLATYLLVRGEHTYLNWLGDGQDETVGQWYPEWDLETGILPFGQPSAPHNPLPANMAAMYTDGMYMRHFSSGWVMVNVDTAPATWDAGMFGSWEKLSVSGGGNINADGSVNGTATWTTVTGIQTIGSGEALIVRDNGLD